MSECGCDSVCNAAPPHLRYRRALWIALVLNALMFGVELAASFSAQSVALLAGAVDFLGDAGNYAVALFVLGLAPVALAHRAVEGLADGRLRHLRARQRTAGRTLWWHSRWHPWR